MKTSILKPNMTLPTVASTSTPRKLLAVAAPLPQRQPLPRALIDRSKPMLKLGLDVHLEFAIKSCPIAGGAPVIGKNFPRRWMPGCWGVLNKLRELILAVEDQLAGLETEILATVKHLKAPKGLGELSLAIRSEERRVGKGWRSGGASCVDKKK